MFFSFSTNYTAWISFTLKYDHGLTSEIIYKKQKSKNKTKIKQNKNKLKTKQKPNLTITK